MADLKPWEVEYEEPKPWELSYENPPDEVKRNRFGESKEDLAQKMKALRVEGNMGNLEDKAINSLMWGSYLAPGRGTASRLFNIPGNENSELAPAVSSPEATQAILETLRGRNPLDAIAEMNIPHPYPPPETITEKVLTGAAGAGGELASGLTTPDALETMMFGAPGARIFQAQMIKDSPQALQNLSEAAKTGDIKETTKAALGAGMALGGPLAIEKGLNTPGDVVREAVEKEPLQPVTEPVTQTKEESASTEQKATEIHGGMLSQPTVDEGKVPTKEGVEGIQSEAQGGLPQETLNSVGKSPTSDQLLQMTPEQSVEWKRANQYSPAVSKAIAEKLTPEEIQKLNEQKSNLQKESRDLINDLKPNDDAKMAKAMNISLKAQTLREIVEDYQSLKKETPAVESKKETPITSNPKVEELRAKAKDFRRRGVPGHASELEYTANKLEQQQRGLQLKQPSRAISEAGAINLQPLQNIRDSFQTLWRRNPTRDVLDQTLDAADNQAKIAGQRASNTIKLDAKDTIVDEAASAVVAAGFDRTKLNDFLNKAIQGDNKKVQKIIRFAMKDWGQLQPIAQKGKALFDRQLADENGRGIETERHEDYLPGIYDMDLMMGQGKPFVIAGSRTGGTRSGFKKGKTYATPFDAIADGYQPKSLKLSDLVENRIRAGQMLINRMDWGDSLRSVTDPLDNKPVVESLKKIVRPSGTSYESAPMGYVPREIVPGMRVAVHEGYERLFDALTGRTSGIRQFEVGGVPVGALAMEGVGGIKHGTLLVDTYHAARVMAKDFFLTGAKSGYKKGLSILEYSPQDLQRAVRSGEITPEQAAFANANRPTADLLLKNGLNVGRVQQAMYTNFVRKIPGIGGFNKWVFDKLTRGAMMESGLIGFDRVKRANPNMSDTEVARKVSRDLNTYFGNLQRQGVFKSQTMLDLSSLAGFAPQWVESQIRSELGGYKQLAADPILKQKLAVGTLGTGMARGLAAAFIATQLLNFMTKGKPTWENEENQNGGSKLDAWIPDLTGKTKGYRVSPMSISAENTHDLINAIHDEPDVLAAAGKIASNKAGSAVRIGKILLQGRDWNDKKIIGDWSKIKAAAVQSIPAPIPLSSLIKGGHPGTAQRRIMQSFGVNSEPVKSARQEISNRATKWGLASDDEKVRTLFQQKQKEDLPESQYKPLRNALIENNPESIRKEVVDVLNRESSDDAREKKLNSILSLFNPINKKDDIKPVVTGSKEAEAKFISSLDDKGRRLYMNALRERAEDYRKLSTALFGREVQSNEE